MTRARRSLARIRRVVRGHVAFSYCESVAAPGHKRHGGSAAGRERRPATADAAGPSRNCRRREAEHRRPRTPSPNPGDASRRRT